MGDGKIQIWWFIAPLRHTLCVFATLEITALFLCFALAMVFSELNPLRTCIFRLFSTYNLR